MVDYVLMNHFRIKYENSFPSKLSNILQDSLKKEIPIMIIDRIPYFCNNFQISNNLPLDQWYIEFYRLCKRDKLDKVFIDKDLCFIPIAIYKLDPLDKILEVVREYPEYGKELPSGHQSVVIAYQNNFYYYDPHGYDNIINKLKTIFPNIQPLHTKIYNDNFCILHCINLILNIWKDPTLLFNPETFDSSHKRLSKLCKKLF